jgi:hypothetical protein
MLHQIGRTDSFNLVNTDDLPVFNFNKPNSSTLLSQDADYHYHKANGSLPFHVNSGLGGKGGQKKYSIPDSESSDGIMSELHHKKRNNKNYSPSSGAPMRSFNLGEPGLRQNE